ncbi:MAG TPA: hypothetical protein VGT24_09920 [Candidatus Acidoferrales bacterium]|nr:hypothetical protein [Candidatus Acidoferrales bacterium]
MDETLRSQIDTYLLHLDGLIRRGEQIRDLLSVEPSNVSALAANRTWQRDCGVTINQLSGGSKAHWLARAFSEAFLMRSASGEVIETVAPEEIAARLLSVLKQAVDSLRRMGEGQGISSAPETAPAPRRFEFVHNAALRPVVEQAHLDSRRAMEQGNHALALVTSCGILEAIVTDALEYKGVSTLADAGIPEGKIADWPFETRLAVAESAGLIRGGWARLPDVARKYRELTDAQGNLKVEVSENDARRAGQVLHVVMRDLDPGR